MCLKILTNLRVDKLVDFIYNSPKDSSDELIAFRKIHIDYFKIFHGYIIERFLKIELGLTDFVIQKRDLSSDFH